MRTRGTTLEWHARSWSALGWLETAAKAIGIGAALVGVVTVATAASVQVAGLGYGVVGVAGVTSLLAVVQLGLRIGQKEVVSLGFAALNLLGHAALAYLVLYAPAAAWVPATFGTAYVAGELVKQRFLVQTGYTESGQSTKQIVRFSRGVMGLHALMATLALLR